jgi:hypothetical protein
MLRGSLTKTRSLLMILLFLLEYGSSAAQERIYVHYDREYCLPGEAIWFKAYLYNKHLPVTASKTLFVQLVDTLGQVVAQKKFPVLGSTAKGSIGLSDTLPGGLYVLRAFTPAQIADPAFISHTKFYVLPSAGSAALTRQPSSETNLAFFPEGGNLVEGIKTVVAFRAADEFGHPLDVEGKVRSSDGETVTDFRSVHNGMGQFSFRPQAGKSYYAEATVNGKAVQRPLPAASASGVSFKVENETGGKAFRITRGWKDAAEFDTVTLEAYMGGKLVYTNEYSFGKDHSLTGLLLTDKLKPGILHMVVSNRRGVLAQRLCFVHPPVLGAPLQLSITRVDTARRSASSFEVKFSDTVARSFSIAVTDASDTVFGNGESIFTHLWLRPALDGYIHAPCWYFEKDDWSRRQALDNLLLTHTDLYNGNAAAMTGSAPAERSDTLVGISFSGKVRYAGSQKPAAGGTLKLLMLAQGSALELPVPVSEEGRFRRDSLIFFGKATVFYTYLTKQGRTRPVEVVPDRQLLDSFNLERIPLALPAVLKMKQKETIAQAATLQGKGKVMEEVVVRTKKSGKLPADEVNERYASRMYKNMGRMVVDNINRPYANPSLSVIEFILQSISELRLTAKMRDGQPVPGQRALVNSRYFELRTGAMWEVEIFLDEMRSDVEALAPLQLHDVAMIKYLDVGTAAGAVCVYLKKPEDRMLPNNPMGRFSLEGYALSDDFYHPDYSRPDPRPALPDQRRTLYWNPDAYTNAAHPSFPITFYNNDHTKKFRVVIEGYDLKGNLFRVERVLE